MRSSRDKPDDIYDQRQAQAAWESARQRLESAYQTAHNKLRLAAIAYTMNRDPRQNDALKQAENEAQNELWNIDHQRQEFHRWN